MDEFKPGDRVQVVAHNDREPAWIRAGARGVVRARSEWSDSTTPVVQFFKRGVHAINPAFLRHCDHLDLPDLSDPDDIERWLADA